GYRVKLADGFQEERVTDAHRPDGLGCSRSVAGYRVHEVGRAVLEWNQRAIGRVVQLITQIDRDVIRRGRGCVKFVVAIEPVRRAGLESGQAGRRLNG